LFTSNFAILNAETWVRHDDIMNQVGDSFLFPSHITANSFDAGVVRHTEDDHSSTTIGERSNSFQKTSTFVVRDFLLELYSFPFSAGN